MAATKSRGSELIGVATAFLVLSWIFTILRFYSRAIVVRQVGSDDYLAFAAQVWDTPIATVTTMVEWRSTRRSKTDR